MTSLTSDLLGLSIKMSLNRPTRSIHLLQTGRTSEDRQFRANVDLHMWRTKTKKLKICMIMHIWARSVDCRIFD